MTPYPGSCLAERRRTLRPKDRENYRRQRWGRPCPPPFWQRLRAVWCAYLWRRWPCFWWRLSSQPCWYEGRTVYKGRRASFGRRVTWRRPRAQELLEKLRTSAVRSIKSYQIPALFCRTLGDLTPDWRGLVWLCFGCFGPAAMHHFLNELNLAFVAALQAASNSRLVISRSGFYSNSNCNNHSIPRYARAHAAAHAVSCHLRRTPRISSAHKSRNAIFSSPHRSSATFYHRF